MIKRELKITKVSFQEFTDLQFRPPASFWVKDALGVYNFIHTRDRMEAKKWSDSEYGVNFFQVNAARTDKPPENQSAVGRINSKSRAGSRKSS